MKTYKLEYNLADSGALEEAIFQADDKYEAEDLLEEFLSTEDYDLISCMEAAE
jgi:hypothetical protein